MATHSTLIGNPTAADVTVNDKTIAANAAATVELDDSTTDAYDFSEQAAS